MKVFLAFKSFTGGYTIWGTTEVKEVDESPMETGAWEENGYSFVHFEPFDPLPRDKWVSNLSDRDIVGESWRQGRFRYIDANRESYLEKLIAGERVNENTANETDIESIKPDSLNIRISPTIQKRLEQKGIEEGRTTDEIVREAIAEWLRDRRQ
jgi:hypothetical protein